MAFSLSFRQTWSGPEPQIRDFSVPVLGAPGFGFGSVFCESVLWCSIIRIESPQIDESVNATPNPKTQTPNLNPGVVVES